MFILDADKDSKPYLNNQLADLMESSLQQLHEFIHITSAKRILFPSVWNICIKRKTLN